MDTSAALLSQLRAALRNKDSTLTEWTSLLSSIQPEYFSDQNQALRKTAALVLFAALRQIEKQCFEASRATSPLPKTDLNLPLWACGKHLFLCPTGGARQVESFYQTNQDLIKSKQASIDRNILSYVVTTQTLDRLVLGVDESRLSQVLNVRHLHLMPDPANYIMFCVLNSCLPKKLEDLQIKRLYQQADRSEANASLRMFVNLSKNSKQDSKSIQSKDQSRRGSRIQSREISIDQSSNNSDKLEQLANNSNGMALSEEGSRGNSVGSSKNSVTVSSVSTINSKHVRRDSTIRITTSAKKRGEDRVKSIKKSLFSKANPEIPESPEIYHLQHTVVKKTYSPVEKPSKPERQTEGSFRIRDSSRHSRDREAENSIHIQNSQQVFRNRRFFSNDYDEKSVQEATKPEEKKKASLFLVKTRSSVSKVQTPAQKDQR